MRWWRAVLLNCWSLDGDCWMQYTYLLIHTHTHTVCFSWLWTSGISSISVHEMELVCWLGSVLLLSPMSKSAHMSIRFRRLIYFDVIIFLLFDSVCWNSRFFSYSVCLSFYYYLSPVTRTMLPTLPLICWGWLTCAFVEKFPNSRTTFSKYLYKFQKSTYVPSVCVYVWPNWWRFFFVILHDRTCLWSCFVFVVLFTLYFVFIVFSLFCFVLAYVYLKKTIAFRRQHFNYT